VSDLRPWLEMELTRQLSPVAAPESLWNSLQTPRTKCAVPRREWLLWPAIALTLLFACGALFWNMRDITQLTGQEVRSLTNPSQACDCWSDDPVAIRNWVKSKGNIDVDLPAQRSGAVRPIGARLVDVRGTLVAAISFHVENGVENGAATLLVSNRRFSGPDLVSWKMGGQVYEMASAASDSQGACLLCHL
jgi:hypothetical protein